MNETLFQQELREDFEAAADYHYELWYSEMESMRRDGEIEMQAMNDEDSRDQELRFEP